MWLNITFFTEDEFLLCSNIASLFQEYSFENGKLVFFPYLFYLFCKQWLREKLTVFFSISLMWISWALLFSASSAEKQGQTPRHRLLTHISGCTYNESQWEMSICCSFPLNSTCLWCYLQVNCKAKLISLFYVIYWNILADRWQRQDITISIKAVTLHGYISPFMLCYCYYLGFHFKMIGLNLLCNCLILSLYGEKIVK